MLKISKVTQLVIIAIFLSIFSLTIYVFNTSHPISINNQTKNSSVKYEKAEVLSIVSESLKDFQNENGMKLGNQVITVKVLTGKHKGETKQITNYVSDTHNVYVKSGMKIIVEIDTAGSQYDVVVYNYYRAPVQYVFIFIFFLALCGIGGKKGFRSVLGLIFTFISITFLYIPMLFKGYSPVTAAIIIISLVTCITLFLLDGFTPKTLSAVFGTVLGVSLAGIIALIVGYSAHLSGFNTQDVETLNLISAKFGMKVQGLLLSGILIASLGAVMDLSISIASSVQEVYTSKPKISSKELFLSGMNVGRDMMGTMANTLILAFTGTSLNILIIIYFYNVGYNQLINMDMVNVEIIQGLTGSLAVILTVPIISFISSKLIPALSYKSINNKKSIKKNM